MVHHTQEQKDVSLEACNWIDKNLRVSKSAPSEMNLDLIYLEKANKDSVMYKDGLVITPYLDEKAEEVVNQMKTNVFRHFVIMGDEGCGKMSLVRLLKDKTENRNFIVVTLEETFDSKNLVGTYVCNETGEFVFKKGPLTVAAEQGLWLVLRNIN
jgi:midasin (ATPase involved in ribosome maturation)